MVYLASPDADETKNSHAEPHLSAGDAAIIAKFDDGVLDRENAIAIESTWTGPSSLRRGEPAERLRWDAAKKNGWATVTSASMCGTVH